MIITACITLPLSYLFNLERAFTQPFSDVFNKAVEFNDAFTRLKERFTVMSSIHIAFISSRTLDLVEDLSAQSILPPPLPPYIDMLTRR